MSETPLKILFWGTYDLSKPRNRILLQGLRECGSILSECHESIWERVRDKGTLKTGELIGHLLHAVRRYPRLVLAFLRAPAPDVVLVGYLGHLDVLVLWPFARLRGVPVVWDQFISLHDTVVEDRAKLSRRHPLAGLLYAWEWLACRAVDCVLMDTAEHAAHVRKVFGLSSDRVQSVWVGAETRYFHGQAGGAKRLARPLKVLFYGQFIPLHGVDTIVRAAQMLEHEGVHFLLIGTGQEESRIREFLATARLSNLEWKTWVEYEALVEFMHEADVCLGIFGSSGKASRVIPNKVFQIVAARRPLVTRDSPAIRELFRGDEDGLWLVPPSDPGALADTLRRIASRDALPGSCPHAEIARLVTPLAIGQRALTVLRHAVQRAQRP